MQHECALRAGADAIITRHAADFAQAKLPVFSPLELQERLKTLKQ